MITLKSKFLPVQIDEILGINWGQKQIVFESVFACWK